MKNESSVKFAKFEKKKLTLSKFHEKYHRRPRGFEDSDLDERKDSKEYMKSYPSLPYGTECHLPIVAFDKLDGSNVRAEWTSKKGWTKFGTRNRLVDSSDPIFGQIPEIVETKFGKSLHEALLKGGFDRAMCFFELYGPKSFAGMHDKDDQLTVTLIDVAPYNQGILEPERYLKYFGHLDIAKVLYTGELTPEFIESVRNSTLPGMTFEGVVCKAKNNKKTKMPLMFKQKSQAWLNKLREHCGTNDELFRTLRLCHLTKLIVISY